MKLFRLPPHPAYHLPHCSLVGPDGTLLYISFSQLVAIEEQNGVMSNFVMEAGSRILAFDADPDFGRTRYVATSTDDRNVWIWDLDKRAVIFGHTAHVEKSGNKDRDRQEIFPLCFTLDKKVLTMAKNRFVTYCVASNTYKISNDVAKKHVVTLLRASPYNPDIFAAGTLAGLIMVMSVKTLNPIFTMRGHDTEIRSLDWIKVIPEEKQEEDLFDMYTYDDVETEFGVIKDKGLKDDIEEPEIPNSDGVFRAADENTTQASFDFTEACESLRQQILYSKDGENVSKNAAVMDLEFVEKSEMKNGDGGEKTQSFASSNKSVSSRDSLSENELQRDAKKDFDMKTFDQILLVSSAYENTIWIWDVKTGRSLEKIHIPTSHRPGFKTKTYCAKWLNSHNILTTDHTGFVTLWDIEFKEENCISIHKSRQDFSVRAITDIAIDLKTEKFWTISMHGPVTCLSLSEREPLIDYTSMVSKIYAIVVNPIDPNVIAIAGNKRISFLNLSNVTDRRFVMSAMNNQVQSQVLSLAWHPQKENCLAFSTREGRVGVFDTAKCTNSPCIMKPYFSKDVYSTTWGEFLMEGASQKSFVLFCSGYSVNKGRLVYYPQEGKNRFAAIEVGSFQNVAAVLASSNYLAVGTSDGRVCLSDLSDSKLLPFYDQKLSQKIISGFDFRGKNLAIASFDSEITILTINSKTEIQSMKLKGHTSGVTFVNWDLRSPNKLVSASNDCTIKVWNTEDIRMEATASFERETYAAIFHPQLENTIIAAGLDLMMTVFNYKDVEIDFKFAGKYGSKPHGAVMAKLNDLDIVAKSKKERRRKKILLKNVEQGLDDQRDGGEITVSETDFMTEQVTAQLENVVLTDEATSMPVKSLKPQNEPIFFNYTTIFCLTNRELNREPIGLLKRILSKDDHDTNKSPIFRHEKLMSQDTNIVKALLKEEQTNLKTSNVKSIGHLALPMLTMDIKTLILEKIDSKTLTEEHITMAPFISHAFWKSCCLAYALQCVEQGLVLKAISYFLCCNEVNDAISILCKEHYYSEAMAVARMRKTSDDLVFREICQKWTNHLVYCGNFEAAAVVWSTFGDNKEALQVLERRINPNEELQTVIQILKELTQTNGTVENN